MPKLENHKKKDKKYYNLHKEAIIKKRKQYASKNKAKVKAALMVNYEIRKGRIKRPSECSNCNKPCKPDAHHDDYNKPLEVSWLCRRCHLIHHHGI